MNSSGMCCRVHTCRNSRRKIAIWKKTVCEMHGILHEDCPCLIPFSMHIFPKDEKIRKSWLEALGINEFGISKTSMVCSDHFVDGRPTKIHPTPTLHLKTQNENVEKVCLHDLGMSVNLNYQNENIEDMTKSKEVSFETPLGTVAAKVWGPENGRPVLALHGWQDNAGTFDTLLPHLSENLRVVALDFIGHGFSSHRGPGHVYRMMDHCWEVKYVTECLKWNKYTILAHSMGACVALIYASIFPEEVLQLISLDLVKPPIAPLSRLTSLSRKLFDLHSELEEKLKQKPPSYFKEEAIHKLAISSSGSVTEQSAAVLLRRGTKFVGDGTVEFTRDLRLKCSFLPGIDYDTFKAYAVYVKTELLIVKATNSHMQNPPEIEKEMKEIYGENCSCFQFEEVPGTHHVHLNNPERVSDIINTFMSRIANESKL